MADLTGKQPAHLAAIRNHQQILEFLYEQGVDLECACQAGKLPVHYASQYGGKIDGRNYTCIISQSNETVKKIY